MLAVCFGDQSCRSITMISPPGHTTCFAGLYEALALCFFREKMDLYTAVEFASDPARNEIAVYFFEMSDWFKTR